jgi:methionine synthase II (cobalamin-independent)
MLLSLFRVCVSPADVLTIENSRSGDAMVSALAAAGYRKDLGPGVYDVHSPQVRMMTSMPAHDDEYAGTYPYA